MPRTFLRNTTALAVGLGVALPQIATAQGLPVAGAAQIAESGSAVPSPAPIKLAQAAVEGTTSDAVPLPAGEISAEVDDSADTDTAAPAASEADKPVVVDETPTTDAAAPEARAEPKAEAAPEPVVTEEPAAETASETGAKAEPETPVVEAEAAPEPQAEPAATPVEAPASDIPAAKADTAAEPKAAPAAEPVVAAEPTPVVVPAPQTEKAPAAPAAEAKPPAKAEPIAADTPVVTDAPSEADLARALAERSGEAEKPKDEAKPAPADKAAAEGMTPVVVGTPADDAAAKADAATPPAAATGKTEAAAAANAAAAAAAAGTPTAGTAAPAKGNAAPGEAELAAALAEARPVPEAEARPTDAAREAAAAATAPVAAALAETAAPVTTSEARELTEETSRSATEDFLTDVRGSLREADAKGTAAPIVVGADGKPVAEESAQSADKGDDRSDLEKVLRQAVLPALAGMVVGQLLSNDRQVALNTGDRVVVTRPDGSQEIIKDDNALMLRPGSTVQNEEYADGSTRTIVTREDGSQVVTIRDADLRVLRRTLVRPDGTTTALIDETAAVAPVDVTALPPPARPVVVAPGQQLSEDDLREALRVETQVDRTFTLGQIRNIPEVRALVAPVDIQAITFDTGSAAINPDQAQALSTLGRVIKDSVARNPAEIYLIEGHTDTVGADAMNLALSDRRAESVALALTEFFGVPPENMVVQGYGEQFLRVGQEGDVRANRRASVRRISDLLARN